MNLELPLAKLLSENSNSELLFQLKKSYKDGNSKTFIEKLNSGDYDQYFNKPHVLLNTSEIKLKPFKKTEQNKYNEYECAIYLYEKLNNLNREELNDKRLWVYLSLYVYRDFTTSKISDQKIEVVKNNLFYEGTKSSTNYRNYLAKLFWSVNQTVDEDLDDKYHYTKLILDGPYSQLFQDMTQRTKIFINKKLLKSTIKFYHDIEKSKKYYSKPKPTSDWTLVTTTSLSKLLTPLIYSRVEKYSFTKLDEKEIIIILNTLLENYIERGDIKYN